MMPRPKGPFAGLICSYCGEHEQSFAVVLDDLETLQCRSCGETFTVHQAAVRAERVLMGWDAYARFTKLAPAVAADAAEAAAEPPPARRRHHDASGAPVAAPEPPTLAPGYPGHDQYPRYGDGEDVPARASVKVANGE
jgi:transcription elongation factor Elf1